MATIARLRDPAHTGFVDAAEDYIRLVDLESCDLLLKVSNQSFRDDPVELTVAIDDVEVVRQAFEVRNQHHVVRFPLRVGPGTHRLTASSETGVVRSEEFTLPASGARRYADIDYYNYADEDGMLIDWHIQWEPIGIR